jgi:hypothetical protein
VCFRWQFAEVCTGWTIFLFVVLLVVVVGGSSSSQLESKTFFVVVVLFGKCGRAWCDDSPPGHQRRRRLGHGSGSGSGIGTQTRWVRWWCTHMPDVVILISCRSRIVIMQLVFFNMRYISIISTTSPCMRACVFLFLFFFLLVSPCYLIPFFQRLRLSLQRKTP